MEQYIISSFISDKGGGNKAAVLLDYKGLTKEEMQYIAKKNNLSETAFIDISKSDKTNVFIRYFTPKEEVDICGHAALASFFLLGQKEMIKGEKLYHKTKAGSLEVIKGNGMFFIEMKSPELVGHLTLEEIMGFADLKKDDIIPNRKGSISIVSTGLKDGIILVNSLDTLMKMKINKERMIEICKEKDIIGAHIVSRETIENDSDYFARNFAPVVGIDEESATGTSNASLISYLIDEGIEKERAKPFKIEQGYFMDLPSNIFVLTNTEDKRKIFVGGKCRFIEKMLRLDNV